MERFDKLELPREGRRLVVYCPEYCSSGYLIGEYRNGRYDGEDLPNDLLHDYVEGRCYLDGYPY